MMVVVDLAGGDAGAIEDALKAAWQLQRSADRVEEQERYVTVVAEFVNRHV